MKQLSQAWKKLIVWVCAYANVIALCLSGGYFLIKDEDEDVKESVKTAFLTYAVFAALSLLQGLIYNVFSVFGAEYDVLSGISDFGTVITILRTLAFVALFILDLCGIKITSVASRNKEAIKAVDGENKE